VNQQQWRGGDGVTAFFDTCGPSCPVERLSWNDACGGTTGADCAATSFIGRLNQHLGTTAFRLPSEADWERAARADTQTRFSHGDVLDCGDGCEACTTHDQYMWWCGNANSTTHLAGQKQPNAFGLHDMHGNVWEWVADWYAPYGGDEADPQGPASGTVRVLRGGSWNHAAQNARSACRYNDDPDTRKYNFGLRLARSVDPAPVAPDAAFIWTPANPEVGQTVQFTDSSTGSPTS
jgi:formylglycine-generating enzyme required for sulfatase activity